MTAKLALGTVQFGAVYGINNKTGRISEKDAASILDRAWSDGVDMLDTAQAYAESEVVLGRVQPPNARFKIISKFTAGAGLTARGLFADSRVRLNAKKLYAFLYHKFSDFRDYPGWHEDLLEIKARGFIEKVGFSIYYPRDLQSLLDGGVKFDLVQLPYSVFDRRFEPLFPALRKQGIEVHVRSVFLQGLSFMKPSALPPGLAGLKGKLASLHAISEKSGIPVSALCLCFGLLNPGIDRMVIGVDGLSNLENNLAGAGKTEETKKFYSDLCELQENNEDLILPFKWGK